MVLVFSVAAASICIHFLPHFTNFFLQVPAKTWILLSCLCGNSYWSGFAPDGIYLNTLVCLQICHFCADVTFHSRAWVAFRAGCYQRDFFAHIYCGKRKVLILKCAVLFILVWRFSVTPAIKAFNKKTVCGITLYCFTWSGKALHQTAGAV